PGTSLKCWRCCNNISMCSRKPPIDQDCGNPDYSNLDYLTEWEYYNFCVTTVYTGGYNEGTVYRNSDFGNRNSDEDCRVWDEGVECYCYDDECNNNLREHCLT
ncbi:unnamed protein product, partial [Meganyctiphanes norvegica]